ncbi:hypothetical protein GCM10009107_21980 [Ideonella azotifigens]|uniref:Transposase zinc-binding domain-containing protein n=1 Tax=Ideonella azotifigens TaxID=513160 RepID=A0ABP3VBJ9_9BURK
MSRTRKRTKAELPSFIKDEFDAFLECGILAHGFLRLRCGKCSHDNLAATAGSAADSVIAALKRT